MAAKSWQLTLIKIYTTLTLLSIAVSVISAAQDHDVPVSVDGLRCDSCGSECSVMCGSKNFRACCFNYIKKRSIPWSSASGGSGGGNGAPSDNQDSDVVESQTTDPLSGSHLKASGVVSPMKTPILIQGVSRKHFLRGHVPDMIGGDSAEEEFIYPVRIRDLVTNVIRNLNAFENKKFARALLY